jgi:hypothetical protein
MDPQSVYGKIFTKEEADKLFGPVLESTKFSMAEFKKLLAKTNLCIMFKYEPGKLYIFDKKRNVIYPEGDTRKFSSADVLKLYSLSVVEELINKTAQDSKVDGDDEVEVERREEVVSTSTTVYTMEVGTECPPYCPTDL